MQELRTEVREVMDNELTRANSQFPLFNSKHEGIGVIREEMHEANVEIECLKDMEHELEVAVFKDKPIRELHSIARQGCISAIEAACELIQTAAMFDKFRTSIDQKKAEEQSDFMKISDDEFNRIVDEFFGTDDKEKAVKRKCVMITPKQMAKLMKDIDGIEGTEAE